MLLENIIGLPYNDVAKIIKSKNNDKILELGCGPALILDYIKYENYVGIDSNKEHLEYASKKYTNRINTKFLNADFQIDWDKDIYNFYSKCIKTKNPVKLMKGFLSY